MALRRLARFDDRLSAHIGFLLSEVPFADRFEAAAKARFRAVEHPNPFSTSARDIAKQLAAAGLTYVQTSFPAGGPTRGEKGFAALPERTAAFRASVEPTLDYAAAIGCRLVHAMAGVRPPGIAPDALWET